MQYDLKKYEKAFPLLGQGGNWKTQVPDFARQVMVFIALNLDYRANANAAVVQDIIGSDSGLKWDDTATLKCLDEIKKIGGL